MAALLHLYFGSRATLQTAVSVWILQAPHLLPKYCLLVFPRVRSWVLHCPVLFINDLPLSWESRNGLFNDDATFYASTPTLTDVQLQLQRDLNITATWTKEHGMVAHPEKKNTKYMIISTRQKLFRCEECALTLFLDGRKLEQAQEERLVGQDIDPTLS